MTEHVIEEDEIFYGYATRGAGALYLKVIPDVSYDVLLLAGKKQVGGPILMGTAYGEGTGSGFLVSSTDTTTIDLTVVWLKSAPGRVNTLIPAGDRDQGNPWAVHGGYHTLEYGLVDNIEPASATMRNFHPSLNLYNVEPLFAAGLKGHNPANEDETVSGAFAAWGMGGSWRLTEFRSSPPKWTSDFAGTKQSTFTGTFDKLYLWAPAGAEFRLSSTAGLIVAPGTDVNAGTAHLRTAMNTYGVVEYNAHIDHPFGQSHVGGRWVLQAGLNTWNLEQQAGGALGTNGGLLVAFGAGFKDESILPDYEDNGGGGVIINY
jgi:hypothetical protein